MENEKFMQSGQDTQETLNQDLSSFNETLKKTAAEVEASGDDYASSTDNEFLKNILGMFSNELASDKEGTLKKLNTWARSVDPNAYFLYDYDTPEGAEPALTLDIYLGPQAEDPQ
jgi:hypothetical protein